VFVLGGLLPLVWFMVSRWFSLRPAQTPEEQFVVPASVLAVARQTVFKQRRSDSTSHTGDV
ncbi:MAG: hypothetical protein V3W32_01070, partial [Gemmatimonadota bacterium]